MQKSQFFAIKLYQNVLILFGQMSAKSVQKPFTWKFWNYSSRSLNLVLQELTNSVSYQTYDFVYSTKFFVRNSFQNTMRLLKIESKAHEPKPWIIPSICLPQHGANFIKRNSMPFHAELLSFHLFINTNSINSPQLTPTLRRRPSAIIHRYVCTFPEKKRHPIYINRTSVIYIKEGTGLPIVGTLINVACP